MAFCVNCGAEIPNGSKFCPNCGSKVATIVEKDIPKEGTITFARLSSPVAKAVKTKVVVDGIPYGELRENERLSVNLPFGTHSVTLKASLNPAYVASIIVDEYHSNITYPFKIKMSGKPEPVSVNVAATDSSPTFQPQKKKKGRGLGIAVAVLLILFAMVVAIGSSGSGDKTSSSSSSSKPVSTKMPESTPSPEPLVYSVGDTVEFDGLKVKVTGYTFSRYAGGFGNLNPADHDNVYLVVYVDVKNPTNETKKLSEDFIIGSGYSVYNFQVLYDNEYKYLSSYADYSDFLLANESIMPLGSLTGKVLNYKVPLEIQNSSKSLELTMSYNSSSNKEIVTWRLR